MSKVNILNDNNILVVSYGLYSSMQGAHAAHFTTRARVSAAADVTPEWIFVKLPLAL